MSFEITKGPVYKPVKCLIYGPEGIGKTTFAADFPGALFIDTEGGSNLYNVARLPKPTSWTMLKQEICEVGQKHLCQTLVIDTIDWAEKLCINHILSVYQLDSIEKAGYGKGYVYIYEEFGKLLNLLTDVIESGINVVLTAHAMIYKFEQPDEAGSYDRYTLKLTNKTSAKVGAMVKEWADMVLFANYKTIVIVEDSKSKKAKAAGGKRVMYTTHHPNWDAKNRFDLKEELPFEFEAIAACIPKGKEVEHKPAVAAVHKAATPLAPKAPETPKQLSLDPGIPKELADLMQHDGISEKELQELVGRRGYFPADMPVAEYEDKFIKGWIIKCWPQIVETIKKPF